MADRGYESYNVMAHVQEKGWKFLIRIKDGIGGILSGVDLPEAVEPYHLPFRIVCVKINEDLTEALITNLEPDLFPPEELKRLYAMRWVLKLHSAH